jgi:hypothetical protein
LVSLFRSPTATNATYWPVPTVIVFAEPNVPFPFPSRMLMVFPPALFGGEAPGAAVP